MKLISVVTPCYNEEDNVEEVHNRVRQAMAALPGYSYEHIFIDNASTDNTVAILKSIAVSDPRVKVIVNARNFGHIRSPYYGMLQAKGDAVILVVADLQDPPELIADFVTGWEHGARVVVGVKTTSEENALLFSLRKLYYRMLRKLSDTDLVENFTGFGLYDRQVIEALRGLDEPYPYFRGLIAELGFQRATVEYVQPQRKRGKTKNGFYSLFDMAMLGMTSHSKVPLRLATLGGLACAGISFVFGLVYFIYKILFWNNFTVGIAPLVIGLFFFSSVQLVFLGIIGEFVGSIHTHVRKRPLVIEKERVGFD